MRADGLIDVLTDVPINMLFASIVGVDVHVMVDVEVVVVSSTLLIGLESVVPLSYVVEVISDDWDETVIVINPSSDCRVDECIEALARVWPGATIVVMRGTRVDVLLDVTSNVWTAVMTDFTTPKSSEV